MRYSETDEMNSFLQQLIDGRYLEEPASGITKQAIGKGLDSLSVKQRGIFDKDVIGEYVTAKCPKCGDRLQWSEMFYIDRHGICPRCLPTSSE